ncbi:helix-turn-helix domain-containing protein [Gracilibacillus dipsosauri]|uniref:helix-turn-helix domain-containing protein n=1 Tax=Gracilibacillus dipsosauri TaxID=178340 RepID=UPI00240A3897
MENENQNKGEMYSMVDAVVYRINDLCEKNDMSIYELSKLSGVSQSTLNEIMQGRSKRPRLDTLVNIAFAFGIRPRDFLDHPVFDQIEGVHDREPQERLKKRRKKQENQEDQE